MPKPDSIVAVLSDSNEVMAVLKTFVCLNFYLDELFSVCGSPTKVIGVLPSILCCHVEDQVSRLRFIVPLPALSLLKGPKEAQARYPLQKSIRTPRSGIILQVTTDVTVLDNELKKHYLGRWKHDVADVRDAGAIVVYIGTDEHLQFGRCLGIFKCQIVEKLFPPSTVEPLHPVCY